MFYRSLILTFLTAVNMSVNAELVETETSLWSGSAGIELFASTIDGDFGIDSSFGPARFESDFGDYTDSDFKIKGSATRSKITFNASASFSSRDESIGGNIGVTSTKAKIKIESKVYEVNIEELNESGIITYLGVRHTNQKLHLNSAALGGVKRSTRGEFTDFYLGLGYEKNLTETLNWKSQANAGMGDSDGAFTVISQLSWRFTPAWSAMAYAKYYKVDYEKGGRGGSDWYLYKVSEYGSGIGISYAF